MGESGGGTIRIGVGGWTYEPWRGPFYPEDQPPKRQLEYASRRLTSIEINGTFYRTQKPDTFRKWHDETPDDFVFAVKAPRYATNRPRLADAGPSIDRFFSSGLDELKEKLGPINWQFAPNKKFDAADFEAFLALLPKSVDGRAVCHAVEVRHRSFGCAAFVGMARTHGVAIVTAGDSRYPLIADATAPFIYARIMGTTEEEPLGYAADALDLWAKRAKVWAAGRIPDGLATVEPPAAGVVDRRDVYIYVISGHKLANPAAAMALIERLG